ncbi:MAG TPA: MbcA/ParS/Xre antitoxin family protein [Steroidobacteraceae bacterium]|nr:MbcA/ParS/Xre antitoxin family protein [Steroidobacteraceae bacterium]
MILNVASTRHDPKSSTSDVTSLGGAGLRAFMNIAEAWGLTVAEQLKLLGIASRSTFFKWRRERNPRLPRDTLERLSYLLGIYKSLQILLPDPQLADQWVRKPNTAPTFGGRSALDRMLSGQVADLYVVRQYLDTERG